MKTKAQKPSAALLEAREAVIQALKPYGKILSGQEILVLLSHMVGQTIAAQDQRIMTVEMCLRLVARNIEAGNADAMELLNDTEGNG